LIRGSSNTIINIAYFYHKNNLFLHPTKITVSITIPINRKMLL